MEDLRAFTKLIEALRPWLGHLVVVGGWAHRLHRLHRMAVIPQYTPIRTRDADLALSVREPFAGDIGEALKKAGFEGHFSGEHTPPVTEYWLGDEDGGFHVEFLTPLFGNGFTRDGKPDVTVAKSEITAQKRRHLELLLTTPWSIRIGPHVGFPMSEDLSVLTANPLSFVVQKLLIHHQRPAHKKAQDLLYIHDTLELFSASLGPLHALWLDELRPSMHVQTAKRAESISRELFALVTDDVREAALIPQDRRLTPDNLRALCALGLEQIFA